MLFCSMCLPLAFTIWLNLELLLFLLFSKVLVITFSVACFTLYLVWSIGFICWGRCIWMLAFVPPQNKDDWAPRGYFIYKLCFLLHWPTHNGKVDFWRKLQWYFCNFVLFKKLHFKRFVQHSNRTSN